MGPGGPPGPSWPGGAPPGIPQSGTRSAGIQWAMYVDHTPFKAADWTIGLKVAKDLTDGPFDGDILRFKECYRLMRNQMLTTNQGYGRIIYEVERENFPLTFERLQAHPYIPGLAVDLNWVTRHLWMFISRHVTKSFRNSMNSLVGGQELNGLELWRILWIQNEGGAQEVEVADLGALHTFPTCDSGTNLSAYLGEWLTLVQEQGTDLPDRHLRTLLLKMLPGTAKDELKKVGLLEAHYKDIVFHLKKEANKFVDHRVAQVHIQKRFASLPGQKSKVHSLVEAYSGGKCDDPGCDAAHCQPSSPNAIEDRLNMVCAALEKHMSRSRSPARSSRGDRSPRRESSLPRPDAKFEGCWHCGQKGHSRTTGRGKDRRPQCEAFAKLIKENNGLPKDCEGAYEKWAKKHNKKFGKPTISQLVVDELKQPRPEQPPSDATKAAHMKSILCFALSTKPV